MFPQLLDLVHGQEGEVPHEEGQACADGALVLDHGVDVFLPLVPVLDDRKASAQKQPQNHLRGANPRQVVEETNPHGEREPLVAGQDGPVVLHHGLGRPRRPAREEQTVNVVALHPRLGLALRLRCDQRLVPAELVAPLVAHHRRLALEVLATQQHHPLHAPALRLHLQERLQAVRVEEEHPRPNVVQHDRQLLGLQKIGHRCRGRADLAIGTVELHEPRRVGRADGHDVPVRHPQLRPQRVRQLVRAVVQRREGNLSVLVR
mmetsp:Transcript_25250/g.70808  ORF Transcript_25250/g.70808 Transcript_25250/m.70808 type:complete len:262 (-) Transcript_25250:211-996(-)